MHICKKLRVIWKKRLLQLFTILQFFDAYSSLFFPPPVSFKVLSRGVVIPSFTFVATAFSAPNTETALWWWWSGEVLAAVCYFFSRGCLHRTERPGNESFRSSQFILQHLRDVSIWSIQCEYIYMMVIRYTVQGDSPRMLTPFFFFNNLQVIQSSNF